MKKKFCIAGIAAAESQIKYSKRLNQGVKLSQKATMQGRISIYMFVCFFQCAHLSP